MKNVFLIGLMFLTSSIAFGDGETREGGPRVRDGNGTSGGGSLVKVVKDGQVQAELADNFVKAKKPGKPFRLSKELKGYLAGVDTLVGRYGLYNRSFWRENVLGERTEYRLVTGAELPCKDDPLPIDDTSLKQETYGCTKDGVTYLIQDRFDLLRDSKTGDLKRQALAIIHERYHAERPMVEHRQIATVVSGIETLLTVRDEQASGNIRKLTEDELRAIEDLLDLNCLSIFCGGRSGTSAKMKLEIYGGVRFFGNEDYQRVENSIIGVGTRIENSNYLIKDSTILNSALILPNRSDETLIRYSTVVNSVVSGGSSVIVNSQISGSEIDDGFIFYSKVTDAKIPSICVLDHVEMKKDSECDWGFVGRLGMVKRLDKDEAFDEAIESYQKDDLKFIPNPKYGFVFNRGSKVMGTTIYWSLNQTKPIVLNTDTYVDWGYTFDMSSDKTIQIGGKSTDSKNLECELEQNEENVFRFAVKVESIESCSDLEKGILQLK